MVKIVITLKSKPGTGVVDAQGSGLRPFLWDIGKCGGLFHCLVIIMAAVGQTDVEIPKCSVGLREFCYKVAGDTCRSGGPAEVLVGKVDR